MSHVNGWISGGQIGKKKTQRDSQTGENWVIPQ